MIKFICVLVLILTLSVVEAQEKILNFTEGKFRVYDESKEEDGYYIFYDTSSLALAARPIIFIHGYGALNPMIYGQWIKHLTDQGLTVIFPRYQKNLVVPGADKFAENTAAAIRASFAKLEDLGFDGLDTSALIFAGHSYGAAISAYLGINYHKYQVPKPAGLFVGQPGTGPLKPLNLENYDELSPDIKLIVLVGDKDMTVGEVLGRRIFGTTKSADKIFVKHYENQAVNPPISASHYEAYSLDSLLDNHIHNFTYKRSLYMAKTDEVDHHLYWYLLDQLYKRIRTQHSLADLVQLPPTNFVSASSQE